MKTIELNRHNYIVQDDEFNDYNIEKYCNLKLVKDLPKLELQVGLINDIGAAEIAKCASLETWGTGDLVGKVISGYENGASIKSPSLR